MNTGIIKIDQYGYWNPRVFPNESLNNALELFDKVNGKVIIEIGSGLKGEMNGNSVLTWIKSKTANTIYCVDNDQNALNAIRDNINDKRINCVNLSGQEFIKSYIRTDIDLLYLDFWEIRITKDNYVELGRKRGVSHFILYKLASKKLSDKAIILIDDTDHIPIWKHTYLIPQAIKDGFEVRWTGRQTMLTRNIPL